MLSREDNEKITRTGPGTPAGKLLRQYWQPVATLDDLPKDGAPLPLLSWERSWCCSVTRSVGSAFLACIVRTAAPI